MAPRVVIGKDNAGNYGIKCSLPGYNALTDDDTDLNKFSFNSNWNDLLVIHQRGIATPATFPTVTNIPFSDLGYLPFIEVKPFTAGNPQRYYNDYQFVSQQTTVFTRYQTGFNAWVETDTIRMFDYALSGWNQVFYVVYRLGYNS